MRGTGRLVAFGRRKLPIGCPPRSTSPSISTLSIRQQQQQQVNYAGDPKPQPNPAAKQVNPQGGVPEQQPDPEGQAKTIGDAFESAAAKSADKPLELKDTRVIQSAEARATGSPAGVLGGPASYASNLFEGGDHPTLGQALEDAKAHLPADKVATPRDASRIEQAEQRNDPLGRVDPGGVAAAVREAAEYNVTHGFVSPTTNTTTGAGTPGSGGGAAGRGRGTSTAS